MPSRKSRPEPPLRPPIAFHPVSNGEFMPRPPSARAVEAEKRWFQMVEDKHKRLGMTRRQFANSSCGMAAALLAINQAACSSGNETGSAISGSGAGSPTGSGNTSNGTSGGCGSMGCGGGTSASGGSSSGNVGMGGGGGARPMSGGAGGNGAGGGMASPGGSGGMPPSMMNMGGSGGFMVTEEMTENMEMAEEMMMGEEFIFDVQTHTSSPIAEPWPEQSPPDELALEYINIIFAQSDTDVAVITGAPFVRQQGQPNIGAKNQMQLLIEMLAGPRLLIHGNIEPERGASELDYMSQLAEAYDISAWKTYPFEGSARMDSDEVGGPFLEHAQQLGVSMVCAHRGIWQNQNYTGNGSPVDVIRAAAGAPSVNFLVYHSGWEDGRDENHPYDPNAADQFGVDRMIKALEESSIPPGGNVYAELGSTWYGILGDPLQASHVLGKLLLAVGEDNILWGSDTLFNPNLQGQINAFRMFQISEELQEQYGYPAITPQIRAKIFGLNAAAIYGVDVDATRGEITGDDVEALRMAMLHEPGSVPVVDPWRYAGPRTRRQFLQFQKREQMLKHG